jgi:L-cysteine desulfidase
VGYTIKDILHEKAARLLHLETDPGLGCTEPAAIGLCAATAAEILGVREFDSVAVETDPNIYKNAMGVTIPNAGGGSGVDLAAALGATAGDPGLKLQVFARVSPEALAHARELLAQGKVTAGVAPGTQGLFVRVTLSAGGRTAVAVVSGTHDNVSARSLDGQDLGAPSSGGPASEDHSLEELQSWLTGLTLAELVDVLDHMDAADLGYIKTGLALNGELVAHGLSHGPGIGVGRSLLALIRQGLLKKDMVLWACIHAAAGIDSRMGGVPLPAMTLAGSGNQCIAAGMPVVAAAQFATLEDESLVLKAVTLSYLVTCSIKARVGRLSALCGSGVAAGAGVAAAVAYLFGGTVEKIGGAVKNHIECFTPVICDGAKTSCALKVGELAGAGVKNALLALNGCVVRPIDGLVEASPDKTMDNLARLAREGLSGMDPTILDIMLHKCA